MKLKYINNVARYLLLVVLLYSSAHAQVIDGIVAVVDDKVILKSDLDIQLGQIKEQNYTLTEDLTCEVLNQLIIDKIFVVQAGIDSIEVTNDEVDNELNRRIEYFINMFGSSEKLEEYYGKSLFDLKEEFRDDIYQQLLSDKMRGQAFADLDVTPEEVMEFYNSIPIDSLPYFNAEVEVGQIVIYAEPTLIQKRAAKEKAEKIRQDILDGSGFGFQALLYSDDPGSANNDGELGYVKRGQFVPEFEAVAFRLKKDEISEVVETEFGYHIIQMIDRKGDRISTRHILITPDIDNENLLNAEEKANEIYDDLINKKITYQEAVSKYSKDEQSKQNGGLMTNPNTGNTFFEMSQLDGNVALALDNMEVGDISTVMPYTALDGKTGYRILFLQSESPAHLANINTDYSKIKAVAKQAKQNAEMEKWLAKKAENIYIKVNEDYQHCDLIIN
ncbi:MAG: peptidylprolyl isomerase [Bacteroidetes bacterium]|nr:peptidylprolyl isomerase [Bacteroidota bacterium]MCB9225847.1 peptidylprolyl isomerase [Chitinophagales bacterium]